VGVNSEAEGYNGAKGNHYFSGAIDDILVFHKELSPEIITLFLELDN